MPGHKSIDFPALLLGKGHRLDFLPARRQFINHGHIQIAVNHQRQCSRDRRCRHNQSMGILILAGKGHPLFHTKTVLFVGNRQRQIIKFHLIRNQGMGSDRNLCLS